MRVFEIPDALSALQRPGTDLVRESVNGFWRWPGDLILRGRGDFCAARSVTFFGPERCEFYHICVEIYQKSLEPVIVSTNVGEAHSSHSRYECHV